MNIDRYGSCPNCKADWNGGDIFETLMTTDVFMHKDPEDVKGLAKKAYGWDEDNKKKFSKTLSMQMNIGHKWEEIIQCPECRHVFDKEGEEYENPISFISLRIGRLLPSVPLIMGTPGELNADFHIDEPDDDEEEPDDSEEEFDYSLINNYTEPIDNLEGEKLPESERNDDEPPF